MAKESRRKTSRPAAPKSELLRAMLAIGLAVASQSAVRHGLALLALAGYVIAAWLFVTSVAGTFRASTGGEPAPAEEEVEQARANHSADKLRYLRRHWRLVIISEILTGDIPPARVRIPEAAEETTDEPWASPPAAGGAETLAVARVDAPTLEAAKPEQTSLPRSTTETQSRVVAASPASSPKAVKVTSQGDVLVLDTNLEQMQRFDEQGSLLATYSLPELAGMEVLDLDVSPDGKTLYIVDATSRLRVISLVDEESETGEANAS